MTSIVIIGCGYVGRRVAALELAGGNSVVGVVRSESSSERLKASGIRAVTADLDEPDTLRVVPTQGAVIYYFAPPPPGGVRDTRMTQFLSSLDNAKPPQRIVLISTTGVYGDCHGEWVTEDWPPNPQADRAKRRFDAEVQLQAWGETFNVPAIILRVPGIYGPGRLPLKRLREGLPVLREDEAPFSNRIHVDDLVSACMAAARRGQNGVVYNISDGHPTTMTDYFLRVADHAGLPRPPQITLEQARQELSAGMMSYLVESKRLDNRRMREDLGVTLRFPDLSAGLRACVEPSQQD
jgi:nucleoside-diphosphate-sugar epimerase